VTDTETTPYEAFGGRDFFVALVADFYVGIEHDPVLRPLYPEGDLQEAEDRLRRFLEQYWGGPTTYSEQRGHPRLRMRHAAFGIDEDARDRWLGHMRAALDFRALTPELDDLLWRYLQMAAGTLVNRL
jgi:hemoglobin